MTYVFTYIYSAKRDGESVSGQGSVKIISTGNKITESTIYGENGAINIVKYMLGRDHNMINIDVSPMGWFKFDDEEIEDTPTIIKADKLQESAVFSNEK